MTYTVTVVDAGEEKAIRFVDMIYAIAKPAKVFQIRGGIYRFTVPLERDVEVSKRLDNLSPGDIEVRVG